MVVVGSRWMEYLGGIEGYIWCSLILNLSFVDKTFRVKHLMTGHVLDRGLFI